MKNINQTKKEKFLKDDKKGNYDIDGVSFDGEQVVVGGEKVSSNNKKNEERTNKKLNENPSKNDRKQNLDFEEGTVINESIKKKDAYV